MKSFSEKTHRTNWACAWAICCVFFPALTTSFAQEYATTFIVPGARAAANAESGVGDILDIASMYGNPASLAFLTSTDILLSHRKDWNEKIFHENLTVPVLLSTKVALGVGASAHRAGTFSSSSNLKFTEYGIDVGIGFRIYPVLSFGVMFSGYNGVTDRGNLSAGLASLGVVYSPTPDISYGLKFNGLGAANRYYLSSDGTQSMVQRITPDQSVEIGSTMRFPTTRERPIIVVSIAAQKFVRGGDPRLSSRAQIDENRIRGGIEIRPVSSVGMRFGYLSGPFQRGPRFGLVVSVSQIEIAYTAATGERDYRYDVFSLQVRF